MPSNRCRGNGDAMGRVMIVHLSQCNWAWCKAGVRSRAVRFALEYRGIRVPVDATGFYDAIAFSPSTGVAAAEWRVAIGS